MRFFFDCKTKDQPLYDYQGTEFRTSQGAFEFAEVMVQHLRDSLSGEWSSWSIEVRDAQGNRLFSMPVGTAAQVAA
jgi:hypothetical protein